jgi:hypothetical protein
MERMRDREGEMERWRLGTVGNYWLKGVGDTLKFFDLTQTPLQGYPLFLRLDY